MKKNIFEIPRNELAFFMGFIPYLVIQTLTTTMLPVPEFIGQFMRVLPFFSVLNLLSSTIGVKFIVMALGLLVPSFFVLRETGSWFLLELSLFVIAANKVSVNRIAKVYLYVVGIILGITIFSSFVGIIPNLQYVRPDTGAVRNSFGTIYPTDFAAHVFYLYATFLFLYGHKLRKSSFLIGLMLTMIVFVYSDARLDAVTTLGLCLTYPLIGILKRSKIVGVVSTLSYVLGAGISYWLTDNFTWNTEWLVTLNRLVSGRLILGKEALELYGIKLFGQHINFIGHGGSTDYRAGYNFVDSSYMKILLIYGVIFLCVWLVFVTIFSFERLRNMDYSTLIVLAFIAVNSMVAHHMLEVTYNIFAIAFLASFDKDVILSIDRT